MAGTAIDFEVGGDQSKGRGLRSGGRKKVYATRFFFFGKRRLTSTSGDVVGMAIGAFVSEI